MFEKIFGDVKGIFNTITLMELGLGVVYFLIGLIFYTSPYLSDTLVSIVTGTSLIVNGIVSIVSYFKRGNIDLYANNLIYGILLIIAGLLICILKNILTIFLGIYFLVSGAQKINYGLLLKKFHESCWLLILTIGIISLVIGILSFFVKGNGIISGVGICLLGYGIFEIIDVILLRRRSKNFLA